MAEQERARTLLVFAHPALERARINPAMAQGVRDLPGLTFHDLYELYPDFTVDVEAEQRLLADHELIVLQFPLYWYSAPALLKEWLDLVWLHGFAYGERGRALEGKTLFCAVSAGGTEQAYGPRGHNRFTLPDFLRPFEQTAHLCKMRWAEPFALYGAGLVGESELARGVAAYRDRLDALSLGARKGA
ncbi:MAG TPA: NAD(P)H-dependent oxidoreductase [Caulobacteraceae bacterium]|nr:NAD(P)H-dependent oxidoreductase [Caulobacteraceae bacterium]